MLETMRDLKRSALRFCGPFCAAIGALTLAGCVDTAVEIGHPRPEQLAQRQRPAPRQGVSPHGAPVALISLEGAPEDALARFRPAFARATESRDVAASEEPAAAYRLRGYLTAYASPEGATRFAYVFDIFDRNGRRARRLTDEVAVTGVGDPWTLLDDRALAAVAARGADELAAFLSDTPEAIAAAAGARSGVTIAAATRGGPASAPSDAKPLGFAEIK
ncbi:hypothetical protein MSC49_23840 [Methylosinus sp. C49]|uniref:hypothetical protein n=1 Tax=Methylosinus sp. C49 TaxID=2699395 RepID=UPI0013677190|nr:hypothetical protein [Methylosinus sp. C49]BBU62449.1 hypothetical protein MSC49_23840 [Methylosinus sp. C49]